MDIVNELVRVANDENVSAKVSRQLANVACGIIRDQFRPKPVNLKKYFTPEELHCRTRYEIECKIMNRLDVTSYHARKYVDKYLRNYSFCDTLGTWELNFENS